MIDQYMINSMNFERFGPTRSIPHNDDGRYRKVDWYTGDEEVTTGRMALQGRDLCYGNDGTAAYRCILFLILLVVMAAAALIIEAMISAIGTIMLVPVLARLWSLLVLSVNCDDGLPVLLSAPYSDPLSLEDSSEAFNGLSGVGSNSEPLSVA